LALGLAIRGIRVSQGISQEQLALRTGLDRSYMGGVERGDNNVTLLKAHVIARTLGLTLSELLARARL
jgi:transcriptional regulator with XRE-family HTH domain